LRVVLYSIFWVSIAYKGKKDRMSRQQAATRPTFALYAHGFLYQRSGYQ
jgi:hypothetical protein